MHEMRTSQLMTAGVCKSVSNRAITAEWIDVLYAMETPWGPITSGEGAGFDAVLPNCFDKCDLLLWVQLCSDRQKCAVSWGLWAVSLVRPYFASMISTFTQWLWKSNVTHISWYNPTRKMKLIAGQRHWKVSGTGLKSRQKDKRQGQMSRRYNITKSHWIIRTIQFK